MDKIGPYQILEVLHRGPQLLCRAKAPDGRVLALKAAPKAGLSVEAQERFLREAEICRALDHPHVVRVFESGEAEGILYQAMELLEGADLGIVIAEGRQFTWDQKLSIMEQICDGLAYAHERGLVHRDIKPANLFLENSGNARVLDFGTVRVAESELTRVGSAVGTANYMSPEQIHGERCTPASDVFSAGIVFFQFATGRHPFSGKDRSLQQVVSAIVFEAAPKLSELCPDAPEGLEFLLNRALEKDPARRLKNALELKQSIALCRLAMAQGLAAPRPPADEKTRIFDTPHTAAPPEDEKTQVFRRPLPAVAPAVPPKPVPAPPPPVQRAAPQPLPPSGLRFRYCPSCTAANPPDATVCSGCGLPLAAPGVAAAGAAKQTQWSLYAAIAVAAVLAIALVVVLVVKR
jgi:serine/threonine protein kinase